MNEVALDRHSEEASFFDTVAVSARATIGPLHPGVIRRYRDSSAASALYPLERAIALVRCAEAPRVLDVGCGDGSNAVLMAVLGAHVTGFDISPESIATAQARARLNGVEDRTRFLVSTAEAFEADGPPFDVVWCDAVLHHVIPELRTVLHRMRRAQRPGGRTIMTEPVSLSPTLRAIRSLVPLKTDATPGERPLRPSEIDVIRDVYPGLHIRHFRTLARCDRILLGQTPIETAAPWRGRTMRWLVDADSMMNQTALARFASIAVMHSEA